jgi:hypothetical protein
MSQTTSASEIRDLVDRQLTLVEDRARRQALNALLVEPRIEHRQWDYGEPGEEFPYWVVAEEPARGILLVYCQHGFGPNMPWGFLFTKEPDFTSLGMDSQWGWYLEEAFVRSGLWVGPTRSDEPWHLPPEKRFAKRDA